MTLSFTVDRVESDRAVCESEGTVFELPLCAFDGTAAEGGVYTLSIERNTEAEDERRNAITDLFEKLKNKGENKR